MPNPMMEMLSRSVGPSPTNPLAMLTAFRRFASGMTPQRAQQEIERMLADGRMTQDQFRQLKEQAQAFAKWIK